MKKKLIMLILLSVIGSILNWYRDQIIDALWVLAYIIYIPIFIIFNAFLIISIINIINKKDLKFNIISLAILIFIALTTLFFPFRYVKTKLELIIYDKERNIIIEKVKKKELLPDEINNISLPRKYKKISTSGEIHIFQNDENNVEICFWVFRGMLSGSVMLIYSTGGEELIRLNENGHPITSIKKMKENWYYVETDY